MAVRLSALRAHHPLPQAESWYSFLFEVEATVLLEGLAQLKKKDVIGIATRDFLASGIEQVPQPTMSSPDSSWS
jgi:hypothetical protein